jgi:hypothetical protein
MGRESVKGGELRHTGRSHAPFPFIGGNLTGGDSQLPRVSGGSWPCGQLGETFSDRNLWALAKDSMIVANFGS